jgi:hypothetical protein
MAAISFIQVSAEPKIAGFNYASWWVDTFDQPASDHQLEVLHNNGGKSIAIVVTWYQANTHSTNVARDAKRTASDHSVMRAIKKAHSLGMSVMMKPHIDFQDHTWRAKIAYHNANDIHKWFLSYSAFILHYARMAANLKVEYFSVGCELNGMEKHVADWKKLIGAVRRVYHGKLTYSANHDGDATSSYKNIKWWDALDYIGIDAYFKLTTKNDPSVAEMKARWDHWTKEIGNWLNTHKLHKKVIFTEIGFRSYLGTNKAPYEWLNSAKPYMKEQSNAYEAVFQSVWHAPWLKGIYWWYWEPKANAGGPHNADFTPQGKPALAVVKKYFSAAGTTK